MATLNKLTGIVAGEYGVIIPLTIVDEDGVALNLTAYTAVVIKALSPDHLTLLSFTGSFVSAANGTISFTPSSGNTFTRDGTWKGQVQLSATGVLAPTILFDIEVGQLL